MSTSTLSKIATAVLIFLAVGAGNASAQNVSVSLDNGTLQINGTILDDDVQVFPGVVATAFGLPARVIVKIDDGRFLPFPIEDVDRIVFNGGRGDDSFEITRDDAGRTINDSRTGLNRPPITTLIRGGSGSDVLIGGDDVIDEIHYTKDDEIVEGGTGNDVFWRPSSFHLIGRFFIAAYPKPDDFNPAEDFLGTDFNKFWLNFASF